MGKSGYKFVVQNELVMTSFVVTLDKFSGPLELLLKLIEEKHLEITEVSLSSVTEDYLAWVTQAQGNYMENVADFLQVAATLLLIKSRSILPTLEVTSEEKEEIIDLQTRLALYKLFKDLGIELAANWSLQTQMFDRPSWVGKTVVFDPPSNVSGTNLSEACLMLFEKLESQVVIHSPEAEIKHPAISLQDKIISILERLKNVSSKICFRSVGSEAAKEEIVITFLALLELLKDNKINAQQENLFGDIEVEAKENIN